MSFESEDADDPASTTAAPLGPAHAVDWSGYRRRRRAQARALGRLDRLRRRSTTRVLVAVLVASTEPVDSLAGRRIAAPRSRRGSGPRLYEISRSGFAEPGWEVRPDLLHEHTVDALARLAALDLGARPGPGRAEAIVAYTMTWGAETILDRTVRAIAAAGAAVWIDAAT